ncbi:EAL domain-containing protein, partial [Myxococcus llanfairpwllgwyngyllgogerychwyrndrobwllllantysiliogogogochensis]
MSRNAPHKALKVLGIALVILLPMVLASWLAQHRAKVETDDQLRSFSQLALQKTEMVIHEVEEARKKAMQYQGIICSPQHQRYMLDIVRSLLYVNDLIYAKGTDFVCSTAVHPDTAWHVETANYIK